jgi:hypothetical protein
MELPHTGVKFLAVRMNNIDTSGCATSCQSNVTSAMSTRKYKGKLIVPSQLIIFRVNSFATNS